MEPADDPTPAEWVAPGPDTVDEALEELAHRLARAEALEGAAAAWQNDRDPHDRSCDREAGNYLAFADAWRIAAQRGRAQLQRVDWLIETPSVRPLVDGPLGTRLEDLRTRVMEQEASWSVFSAWHHAYGPRCEVRPPLVPGAPAAPSGPPRPIVVWSVDGVLCPTGSVPPGPVPVDGPVCAGACGSCQPAEVGLGAVLLGSTTPSARPDGG